MLSYGTQATLKWSYQMKITPFVLRLVAFSTFGAFLAVGITGTARAADDLSAEKAIAPLVSMHVVNARYLPAAPYVALQHPPYEMPFVDEGTDPITQRLRKAAARSNPLAPFDLRPIPQNWATVEPFALGTSRKFMGLANSASTCPYFGGCQPPDMALAASTTAVVQGVNTSVAVYNTSGVLQPGWPKNAQAFFDVPNPGACDPSGPFLSDPRAIYDPADGRFWVAILQIEGALGLNNCPLQSTYWVAVSQTSDPNGSWNIYSFDMRFGTTNIADYTQIGLDNQAFYFGGNMFNQFGSAYIWDEVFAANKRSMEAGSPVTAHGLKNIKVRGLPIDTLQPVLVEGTSPAAGLFVSSFNIYFGGGQCSSSCSGINVFAMANPLTAPTLTKTTIASNKYSLAPAAAEPGCGGCIETLDTRITGTPVYSAGSIWFALETAVRNGTQTVPGILWGQVTPSLTGQKVTGGTMTQQGLLSFSGDRDASFGAITPDKAGNMIMVFDTMSSTLNPSIDFTGRLATDPPGTLKTPVVLKAGIAPTTDSRWGDYEASSYDGPTSNMIWIASEFPGSTGDWATEIGRVHF
jgi:hypothetical protein